MYNIDTVCVYCGGASQVDGAYRKAAEELGAAIAAKGWNLVCGGNIGIMGAIAKSVIERGGKVTIVIPEDLKKRELENDWATEMIVAGSMHERKITMVKRSQAFVILPGGLGTLDEFFELITWRQLGFHDKPVILANIGGYWDRLLSLVDGIIEAGFAKPVHRNTFQVVTQAADIVPAICCASDSGRESGMAKI